MPRNIDYGLTPFTVLNEENPLIPYKQSKSSSLEEMRRAYHDPNTSDTERDNIYNDMWKLYVNTHFPHISQVHPEAAWVDKDGNIATLHNNGEELPLTKENWLKITRAYTNPYSLDPEAFSRLTTYLHNQGFAHLDEIPQDTPVKERGSDFRLYSEPFLAPLFRYHNEPQEPTRLIPNRYVYDDVQYTI